MFYSILKAACLVGVASGDVPMRVPRTFYMDRKEFLDVFIGIADGFGLQLVGTCVEDSLEFEGQVQEAVEDFITKDSVFIFLS